MAGLEELGFLGLFVGAFLSATLLPSSSEGIVAYLVSQDYNLQLLFIYALAGNYLGSVVNYFVGLKGTEYVERRLDAKAKKRIDQAQELFSRWGAPTLILAWVPIIGDPLTLVAGIAGMKFGTFSFWVIIGKGLRYIFVIWLAARFL